MILEVDRVCKTFGPIRAVQNISASIPKGCISGFLGPNGAGKTTLIRMIMDILKPDRGTISLADGLEGSRKNHIGYLPEERGLYTKAKVRDTLIYFARLKGLSKADAMANADDFLERLSMTATADMAIGKLSKGNQQKIQLISALVARPDLLILDEPFSGLDPVNVKMVSDLLVSLRDGGTSILLSTHQMNQAETFCSHIFLINKGQLILQGELEPIIDQYSGNCLVVSASFPLPESQLYTVLSVEGGRHKIRLNEGVSRRDLMGELAGLDQDIESLAPYRVPLSDIFIQEVAAHE